MKSQFASTVLPIAREVFRIDNVCPIYDCIYVYAYALCVKMIQILKHLIFNVKVETYWEGCFKWTFEFH